MAEAFPALTEESVVFINNAFACLYEEMRIDDLDELGEDDFLEKGVSDDEKLLNIHRTESIRGIGKRFKRIERIRKLQAEFTADDTPDEEKVIVVVALFSDMAHRCAQRHREFEVLFETSHGATWQELQRYRDTAKRYKEWEMAYIDAMAVGFGVDFEATYPLAYLDDEEDNDKK